MAAAGGINDTSNRRTIVKSVNLRQSKVLPFFRRCICCAARLAELHVRAPGALVILAPSLWSTKSRLQRIATKSYHFVATIRATKIVVQAELCFAVRLMARSYRYGICP
jgi:hypothetical protein